MPTTEQALLTPPQEVFGHVEGPPADGEQLDHMLELRLMHEWTAYASKAFSSAWEFWHEQAPLLALDFRYLMDAMLAMAALHACRRSPSQWSPFEGRMVPLDDPLTHGLEASGSSLSANWKIPEKELNAYHQAMQTTSKHNSEKVAMSAIKRRSGMLNISRMYSDRAIEGQRRALMELSVSNVEAVYVTSILVSFNALFMLAENDVSAEAEASMAWSQPSIEPVAWLRLASGTRMIANSWASFVGHGWMARSGVFYGKPDLSNGKELFDPEHSKPFEKLLTYGAEYDAMTDEDRITYQEALSYIGLIYKGIIEGTDQPLATCRRILAMPSRLDPRFTELVAQRQPRAMAMLALMFASTKLLEDQVIWFKGLAESQVPRICKQLPAAWQEQAKWPLDVALGRVMDLW